jgi:hypothetical protein
MTERKRLVILLLVWLLAAGSCILWGSTHLWVAGASVTVIAITSLVYANLPGTNAAEKRQYNVAGAIFLIFGLVLLYIGIFKE